MLHLWKGILLYCEIGKQQKHVENNERNLKSNIKKKKEIKNKGENKKSRNCWYTIQTFMGQSATLWVYALFHILNSSSFCFFFFFQGFYTLKHPVCLSSSLTLNEWTHTRNQTFFSYNSYGHVMAYGQMANMKNSTFLNQDLLAMIIWFHELVK